MATDDRQVLVTGTAATPSHFTVPGNGQIRPKVVFAHYDGTNAAGPFVPTVKILSDGGEVVAICPMGTSVAAGGSADVSWFLGAELDEDTTAANYDALVLSFGPWAYWKLAEAAGASVAFDSSGHGRTLNIATGHVSMGQPGLLATSSQTCAFSIYTTATNVQNFATATTQAYTQSVATVEHWVNTGGDSGNEQNLSCMGTIGAPTSFLWRCYLSAAGQMTFAYQGTDLAVHTVTSSVGVAINSVHQCVYVMDGATVKFYLDGVLAETQTVGVAMNGPLTSTAFINQPSGGAGSRDYDGFIGPVVVYDKVLTSAEIANLYGNGAGATSGGAVASVTAGDTSIVISGTALDPVIETASIDVIAADHPTAADWSNNSHKISSVTDPTNPQDAATKNYVDTHGGAVSSVFTRTGAVVAANGDYNGVVASALTGATQATRYVGATASGAPVSGTFQVGDFIVARDGHVFVCTTAGSPGTWADVGTSGGAAGGDLSGTYPNPGVAAVKGVVVSATPPSANQALVASGASNAAWVTLPGGLSVIKQVPLLFGAPDASGNAFAGLIATANIRLLLPAYTNGVDGFWWGVLRVPSDYSSAGTIIIRVGANDTSGHVTRWIVSTKARDTAATWDTALTAESAQNLTMSTTAYRPSDVTFTLSTTPVAGGDLVFSIERNGSNVADTTTVAAYLFESVFQYST